MSKAAATKTTHPAYKDMVVVALKNSTTKRQGTSRQAIRSYVEANYKVATTSATSNLRRAIQKLLASGTVVKANPTGTRFKLVQKEEAKKKAPSAQKKKAATKKPKAAPAKKPAAKKPKAKKTGAKKATVKKTATKKPAAKKATKKTPKKAAPKKKVVKKTAAKKK